MTDTQECQQHVAISARLQWKPTVICPSENRRQTRQLVVGASKNIAGVWIGRHRCCLDSPIAARLRTCITLFHNVRSDVLVSCVLLFENAHFANWIGELLLMCPSLTLPYPWELCDGVTFRHQMCA